MIKKAVLIGVSVSLLSVPPLVLHLRTQASMLKCPARSPTLSSPSSHQELASRHQTFAFQLYQALQEENIDDNTFISPLSISLALAMTYNGASGQTKAEMAQALELVGVTTETLNHANLALQDSLENADPQVELAIANSLWIREGFPVKPEFYQNSCTYYRASATELDFSNPESLKTINQWVQTNTQQKIQQIIQNINPSDVMFLMNALYFKGEWQQEFDVDQTQEQPFFLSTGQTKQHPLMRQRNHYSYLENDQFQAASLPYGSGRMSLYVFLPRPNSDLQTFHQTLNSKNWTQWLKSFREREGTVELPRFKLESTYELKETLAALGMQRMFDGSQADFSALTDAEVVVDRVTHKTFVEVNEKGTEAAAVTSVGIQLTSAALPSDSPFSMKVDRPFFVALHDNETKTLLFLGAVKDPT